MDYMNVVNDDELLKAIEEMKKNNSPENQSHMLDLLVEAKFFTPVSITPAPDTVDGMMAHITLPPDAKIRFHMIENGKGQRFFLAFTSFDEMKKWRPNQDNQTIVSSFDDYANMVKRAVGDGQVGGFVIDPFGANMLFSKEQTIMIKEVKDGRNADSNKHRIKAGEEVYFGEPLNYPTEMVEAVKKYLSKQGNVQSAYLQLMCQGSEESYLIVLEFVGEHQALFDGVAKAAKPYLNNMCLDILSVENELGRKIYNRTKPFYEKQ